MDRIDGIPGLEQVASLPDSTKGEVTLRITVAGNERAAAEAEVARLEGALRERVGEAIYGLDDETLEGVVGRLLTERGMTISLAESCTGGLVATRLTDVSGSSNYFPLAVVAYSNAAKEMLLGVPHDLIVEHGAVSEPVAKAMAEGVRQIGKTDIGVGITGIAGPTGGTAEKPVGLTYIALSYEGGTEGEKFLFGGDRQMNRWRAATAVLDMVRRHFLGKAQ